MELSPFMRNSSEETLSPVSSLSAVLTLLQIIICTRAHVCVCARAREIEKERGGGGGGVEADSKKERIWTWKL